jgi:hypothetical protein
MRMGRRKGASVCPPFGRAGGTNGGVMGATGELIRHAVQGYAALGLVVALAFLAVGLARVDPGARGAYGFRPLLLPGLVLLWPLVLWRWAVLARGAPPLRIGRRYAATHRVVWGTLAVLLPLLLLGALALRQGGPLESAPIRLAAPAP